MKALGIDLGGKRVGIALSEGVLARPLATLTKERKTSDRLRRIVRMGERHEVEAFVVGLPLMMDGTEGAMAETARSFATRLEAKSGKPVHLWDERLTSVQAEESMRAAGADPARIKELVDQVAAQIILQNWLDRQT